MNVKQAALSLNEFYKAINEFPEGSLKLELEAHVQEMVASMLKNCLMRNQQKNFSLKSQEYQHKQGLI